MAGYDDRLEALQSLALEALDSLAAAPKDHWNNYPDQFTRLERVLAYTGVVLAKTDAPLLFDAAADEMQGALTSLRDSIVDQPQSIDQWTASLLNGLARVPTARGEDMAQEAKDAAATLQRAATPRAAALSHKVDRLAAQATELEQTIETRKQEIDTVFAERRAEADRIVAEANAAAKQIEGRMTDIEGQQATAFKSEQEERADKFQAAIQTQRADFDEQAGQRDTQADEYLETMRRREAETKALVQAIGEYGTGGRYASEVKEQKEQADRWRWITVAVAVLAVGAAIWAAETASEGINDGRLVAKLVISVVLAGLAGYTAKQSTRHRAREESAKGLELDMAVFPVLIDSMEPEKQQEQREKVLDKTIGRPLVSTDQDGAGGPSVGQQIQDAIRRDGSGAA